MQFYGLVVVAAAVVVVDGDDDLFIYNVVVLALCPTFLSPILAHAVRYCRRRSRSEYSHACFAYCREFFPF